MIRGTCIRALLAVTAFALVGTSGQALAQTFPTKPVTLLVPYPAGGASDVSARLFAPEISRRLGQPVIVDNLGGAGGSIAAQKVHTAPADGYLIFQGSANELVLAPSTNPAVRYKSEDFRPLQMYALTPLAILARKDLPASNADELAQYARKRAAEGKPLTYASVGPGSLYHLLGARMSKLLDVPMTHVPYRGGAPAQLDLIGGRVDIFITVFGAPEVEMAKQGRLRFVATLAPHRLDSIQTVPSVNESKSLKGFNYHIWGGYFVRKETPEPVVQALRNAVAEALTTPSLRAAMEAQNREMLKPQTLEGAEQAYAQGIEQFRAIVKSANFRLE